MRIFHKDAARLHAADAPGTVSEEHDVAAQTFHGEILVDGANVGAFRLSHHGVKRIVGNRAAARDRRETTSPPRPYSAIHPVAMQIRAVAAAASVDALREHGDDFIEIAALEIAIRVGAPHQCKKIIFAPVLGRASGHNLLRQNVQRILRDADAIEVAAPHGAHQRRTFDQFAARRREDAALRNGPVPMARAADALPRDRDGPGRSDLADQIHGADIDSEFQRCGRHQRFHFTGL